MSDYLFDGQGPEDPDVARLEAQLRPLRYRRRDPRWLQVGGLALAAAVLLAVGGVGAWLALRPAGPPEPWSTHTASCVGCTWDAGDWLDTTADARAQLEARGLLVAAPGTRLQRLPREDGARLRLEQGEVEVALNAPRGWLVVEIPGAEVVDLGCAYTLRVDGSGNGAIVVRSGAVALEGTTRTEVLAGAAAATWPDGRTGLPVRLDADPALVAAVDRWDQGRLDEPAPLLAAATDRDLVTLWHLLERQDAEPERRPILDRMEELLPGGLPVDRTALLAGDEEALDVLFATMVGLW